MAPNDSVYKREPTEGVAMTPFAHGETPAQLATRVRAARQHPAKTRDVYVLAEFDFGDEKCEHVEYLQGVAADVASIDFADVFGGGLVSADEGEGLLIAVKDGYLAYVERVSAVFKGGDTDEVNNSLFALEAFASMPMLQTLVLDNSTLQVAAIEQLVTFARPGLELSLRRLRPASGEEDVDLIESSLLHLEACGVKVDASIVFDRKSTANLPDNWVLQEADSEKEADSESAPSKKRAPEAEPRIRDLDGHTPFKRHRLI
jgi:hypothetical protein